MVLFVIYGLQEAMPGCIHTVLLLADRDLALRLEKTSSIQVMHKNDPSPVPWHDFTATVTLKQ